MKKEILKCRDCGKVIDYDDYSLSENEYLCTDCYYDKYTECECGKIILQEEANFIDDCYVYCDDCLDENCFYCDDCNEYHHNDDKYYVIGVGNVCESCLNNGDYCQCPDSNNYYRYDDMYYSDREDLYYCSDCIDNHRNELLEYHEFGEYDYFFFKNADEVDPYYIGQEVETEPLGSSNVKGVLNAIKDNNINAVGEEDGSLNYGGVEIVSHPETYEYKLAHKEDYRNLFRDLENLNYGDAGHAGLHFHVTKPNDNVISRVIVLLESFKPEIKKLSRRTEGQLSSWSKFLTDYHTDKEDNIKYQSTKYIKETYIKGYHDRYYALNLTNSNTIEFRFFNGANNFEEFWGALQFIHNIMELALDEERELNTIQWKDLLQGDELIAQAIKQDVFDVEKFAKDTTQIYEKIKDLKEKTKEEIKRNLKNFIKYINRQMSNIDTKNIKSSDITTIKNNSRKFVDNLQNDLSFLESVINTYNMVETASIDSIKFQMDWLKKNAERNGKKYSRYFNLTEKSILKFESEVIA